MRCLTLTQPWAGLVASGVKLIENRPRAMIKREDFGKRFAIHASREVDELTFLRIKQLDASLFFEEVYKTWEPRSRVAGAVIATAMLADALYIGGNSPETTAKMLDKAFGIGHDQARWTFGPTCYVLADVVALPRPVKCRGFQGFWTLGLDLANDVLAQEAAARNLAAPFPGAAP